MTTLILPAILTEDAVPVATELLSRYISDTRANGLDPAWTGARFESYGDNHPYRITSDDLIAVAMLGVNVPGPAALCLTGREAGRIADLLNALPVDVDLAEDRSLGFLAPGGPAYELWDLLKSHHKVGTTLATKVMARKRPRLVPVQDKIVRQAVKWGVCQEFCVSASA